MKAHAAVALVVAIVSASAGVAGADGDHGSDPCALLKPKEITAAFDQPAQPGSNALVSTICQWQLAPTSDRAPGQVNTLVARGARAKKDYARAVEFNTGQGERVSGIGRKAFFAPSTGTLFVLADKKTLYYVQANVYTTDQQPATTGVRDALVGLAQQAEARV